MADDLEMTIPHNPRTYARDVAWARIERRGMERLSQDMRTYREAIQAEMERAEAAGETIDFLTMPGRVILAERLKEAGFTHEAAYAASVRASGT